MELLSLSEISTDTSYQYSRMWCKQRVLQGTRRMLGTILWLYCHLEACYCQSVWDWIGCYDRWCYW